MSKYTHHFDGVYRVDFQNRQIYASLFTNESNDLGRNTYTSLAGPRNSICRTSPTIYTDRHIRVRAWEFDLLIRQLDASLFANEPDDFCRNVCTSLSGPRELFCRIHRLMRDYIVAIELVDFYLNACTSLAVNRD